MLDGIRLGSVAIDLPLSRDVENPRDIGSTALAELVKAGDRVLRPSVIGPDEPVYRVVVGGPGQGKSTVTQLLAQLYRNGLLLEQACGPDKREARDTFLRHAQEQHLPTPKARRWPFVVPLGDYAVEVSGGEQMSLLAYIARLCSEQYGEPVPADSLRSWLAGWAWCLVLDGLDEVTHPTVRATVLGRIADLLDEAAHCDADLFIVATTRPQGGYEDGLSSSTYRRLELSRLTTGQAIGYGNGLADAMSHADPAGALKIKAGLRKAIQDASTQALMTTPLQVVIMATIVRRKGTTPTDRHDLFENYYDAIQDREAVKAGDLATLLGHHRSDVARLHEAVGMELQTRHGCSSRRAGRSTSRGCTGCGVRKGSRCPQQRLKASGQKAIGDAAHSAANLPALSRNHVWPYDFIHAQRRYKSTACARTLPRDGPGPGGWTP